MPSSPCYIKERETVSPRCCSIAALEEGYEVRDVGEAYHCGDSIYRDNTLLDQMMCYA